MAGKGGRKRTTWRKGHTPGRISKPKGAKDVIPRSEKASIRAIAADIILNQPDVIRESLMRGFQASPPKSLPYLTLAATLIGEAIDQRVQVTGPDGGPIQLEAVRTEQLRAEVRERLTKLIEHHPVIEVKALAPTEANAGGNGHRTHDTSTG
jgi:hypothetical protein